SLPFHSPALPPYLHSFPTRRSSDLAMHDSNPSALFSHVAQALGERRIAFICLREALGQDSLLPQLKRLFGGSIIANEGFDALPRSEEHTSELQSRENLVCRLLLEKK